MFEDSKVLDRWLKFELDSAHRNTVLNQKSLKKLLAEKEPHCKTKDNEYYYFDKAMLIKFAEIIPRYKYDELKLPINLYFDMDAKDHCYITDELGAFIIRQLERFENAYKFREGKMWLPYSLGLQLLVKYKTLIQRVFIMR